MASEPDDPASDLRALPCYQLYLGWRRAQAFYADALGDLNPQRMYVLEHVVAQGETPVCQLGAVLGVDPGTISGLLTRMQRDGLVERNKRGDNRLEVFVRATRRGRAAHRRAALRIAARDEQLMAQLQPRDLTGLRRIVAAFEDQDP